MAPEPQEGLPRLPLAHLRRVLILGRVVGRRVGEEAIGHRLDQGWPAPRPRPRHRVTRGQVDAEEVVAVDLNAREAVGDRAVRQRPRSCLPGARDRDRPLVVDADEDEGQAEDAGEVHRLLRVSVRARPVAEVAEHHAVLTPVPGGVGHADGVRDVAPHRDAHRQVPEPVGDPATVAPSADAAPSRGNGTGRRVPLRVLGRPTIIRDGAPEVRDLTGTDLRNAILALAAADVAVSNDSGLLHVAAAIGTPTLGIFGPTSPWHWAPLNPIAAAIRQTVETLPCQPCHKPTCRLRHHRCMRDISAEQVLKVTQQALAESQLA